MKEKKLVQVEVTSGAKGGDTFCCASKDPTVAVKGPQYCF